MAKSEYKYDTEINWQKAKNFIPKDGEIIYYTDIKQIKEGDGKTKINDLPFLYETYNGEVNYESINY